MNQLRRDARLIILRPRSTVPGYNESYNKIRLPSYRTRRLEKVIDVGSSRRRRTVLEASHPRFAVRESDLHRLTR